MTLPSPSGDTGAEPRTSSGPAAAAPSQPEPERLGQYLLLEKLGQGGMGTVYKALHASLKRVVALKVLAAERVRDPQLLARFRREIEVVGRLDHPHVVRATDAGEEHGRCFLAMEFVDGLDL